MHLEAAERRVWSTPLTDVAFVKHLVNKFSKRLGAPQGVVEPKKCWVCK